jgi:hypothetical protein
MIQGAKGMNCNYLVEDLKFFKSPIFSVPVEAIFFQKILYLLSIVLSFLLFQ